MGTIPYLRAEGLALLAGAQEQARLLARSPWDFALEVAVLEQAGLDHTALRWLLVQGFAEQGVETTSPSARHRAFRPVPSGAIYPRSCFVLTEKGASWILGVLPGEHTVPRKPGAPLKPHWEKDVRRLWYGGLLLKSFHRPAPNQDLVFESYEELDWVRRIDDPMPPGDCDDPASRLRYTARRMTEGLDVKLIRFFVDGTGKGICWSVIAPSPTHQGHGPAEPRMRRPELGSRTVCALESEQHNDHG